MPDFRPMTPGEGRTLLESFYGMLNNGFYSLEFGLHHCEWSKATRKSMGS